MKMSTEVSTPQKTKGRRKEPVLLDSRYSHDDTKTEVGVDEAGRGSFWGPLMAGAVEWVPRENWNDEILEVSFQIKDSKKISPKKRKIIAENIKKYAVRWGIGVVSPAEIDKNGITWANQDAFRRALGALSGPTPERVLIDGILGIEPLGNEIVTIEDGDAKLINIAAASIIAKEAHDDWIIDYCNTHAECVEKYDLLNCKGYGTLKHRQGLIAHGPHEHHRRCFIGRYIYSSNALEDESINNNSILTNSNEETGNDDKCLISI
jgi:ribonuclease HII